MSITIAYFTSRKDPKIEWFFHYIRKQMACDNSHSISQIIIIDYHADDFGRKEFILKHFSKELGFSEIDIVHLTPKPCVWQGKHRLTKEDYFAASNARNTAFALCKNDFIACVDDLSAFAPGWLSNVMHAKEHGYIAMGAYKKVNNLQVEIDASLKFDENPKGIDSRWSDGGDGGIVPMEGARFFGCSFAMPIEAALRVNGFDEICDGQGAEDYDFGIRVERTGYKMFYNRNMLTYESEELHFAEGNKCFKRISKPTNYNGKVIGSDHVLLNRVMKEDRTWTISNKYNLRELRNKTLSGQPFPIPTEPKTDWRDGMSLSEM